MQVNVLLDIFGPEIIVCLKKTQDLLETQDLEIQDLAERKGTF